MKAKPQLFPKVALSESFDLEYGAPMPERERTGIGYPVFGSNGVVGRHSKFLITGPGIVVGRKGSVGEVCWSDESFWPIDTAYYLVPKDNANLRWLYWLLSRANLKRLDAATGVPGLNRNDVYDLKVHKPPTPDQQRIAALLDTADEAIAKTEAVIAKLRQVRDGLLHDLLTRGLDPRGQLREPIANPEQFQASPLGLIPKEWDAKPLGAWAEFRSGYAFKNNELSDFGWRVVRITNLHRADFPFWHYNGPVRDSWIVEDGDLLFSWAGVAASIDAYVYRGERSLLNQHIYHLRIEDPDERFFVFTYLQYILPDLRRKIEGGAGQLHLTKEKIQGILIPKPATCDQELARLVSVMKEQARVIECEEKALEKLVALKSGLMTDLLTGRVRVPETLGTTS